MQKDYSYPAFLSYSRHDTAFADKLHHALEYYKLPHSIRKKLPHLETKYLRPIFLDRAHMSIDTLSVAIRESLKRSKFLIVLCTELSAVPNEQGEHWVNVEIETFIEQRGGNASQVIPVVYRRRKESDEESCLPPALNPKTFPEDSPEREIRNILRVDVRAVGMARVCNDVVAKMLGLDPDRLWQSHRRAFIRKCCVLGALFALLAMVAGWWCWDYLMPKVSFYADYAESEAGPVGIHELTREQLATRDSYYRFTSCRYRLRSVEFCDASGNCREQRAWDSGRPAMMKDFVYAAVDDGKVQLTQLSYCNSQGEPYAWLLYPHDESRCRPCLHPGSESGKEPCPIRHWRYLVVRAEGESASGARKEKPSEGYSLGYGQDGKLLRMDYYDESGKHALNTSGWATVEITYDATGPILEKKYYDNERRLARNALGYASVEVSWKKGLVSEVKFKDENGRECALPNGISTINFFYDRSGKIVKTDCRDEMSLLVPFSDNKEAVYSNYFL